MDNIHQEVDCIRDETMAGVNSRFAAVTGENLANVYLS